MRVDYECPECHGPLRRRSESKRARTHFFHRVETAACNQDRYTHNTAVKLIVQAVRDWRAGEMPAPETHYRCIHCTDAVNKTAIPELVTGALPEFTLPDLRRRPDVALVDVQGNPVLLVEVFHRKEVDPVKAEDFESAAYRWIEVVAEDILDQPFIWLPRQYTPPKWQCERCRKGQEAWESERERERQRFAELQREYELEQWRRVAALMQKPSIGTAKKPNRWRNRSRRVKRLAPAIRKQIAQKYPQYRVVGWSTCTKRPAVTALLVWGPGEPPEPRPTWLRKDGESWVHVCRGCGKIIPGRAIESAAGT